MNISRFFIRRPVATLLLTLAVLLLGLLGYRLVPVAPLPQVDFPTILVSASLPGASPETMAATVATLAGLVMKQLGRVAQIGDTIDVVWGSITVEEMNKLRITYVSLRPAPSVKKEKDETI